MLPKRVLHQETGAKAFVFGRCTLFFLSYTTRERTLISLLLHASTVRLSALQAHSKQAECKYAEHYCSVAFCNSARALQLTNLLYPSSYLNYPYLDNSQLSQKDPDEIEVERDFTIRKKIKGIYNKTIESFPSDLDYRNYEETVEDVIFNLVNNIDVEQTNKQVELYQKDHLQQVTSNSARSFIVKYLSF